MKIYLYLLLFLAPFVAHCQLTETRRVLTPEEINYQRLITEKIQPQLNKIDWNNTRRASGGTVRYTIPVVVHVLYEYTADLVPDSSIYNFISYINTRFLKTNADTVNIIDKFKPVAANTEIAFKLATIDPQGNPTRGIDHVFTYLTNGFAPNPDQQKLHQWPQSQYLNIWIVNSTGGLGGAFQYTPEMAALQPYYDGIAFITDFFDGGASSGYTTNLSFNFASYLNLPLPCGYYSITDSVCRDWDGIPDTPPCYEDFPFDCGHNFAAACDTPNRQNIMFNLDSCGIMFTYGQGQYMQNILHLDYGRRDSLVTPGNYRRTGMDNPTPDLMPVADYTISNYGAPPCRFFCVNKYVTFSDASWNDTITNVSWTFSNDTAAPRGTSSQLAVKFRQPGWVTVTHSATGNGTGTTTTTDDHALFIADTNSINPAGYVQEFTSASMDQWPMFNYFNNNFRWQTANVGYYDNSCISYTGYDYRDFPENMTGTPAGDFDDLFTPAFNLSDTAHHWYLNFFTSGASSNANPIYWNDSLEVAWSTDGQAWYNLKTIKNGELANNGLWSTPYTPSWMGNWLPQAIKLPSYLRQKNVIFRFRYHPGADSTGASSGNNFYMDRMYFSDYPAGTEELVAGTTGMALSPNPSNGAGALVLKSIETIGSATITITDVTGKKVFTLQTTINDNSARIELPAMRSRGLYFVHVSSGGLNGTEKWIVD